MLREKDLNFERPPMATIESSSPLPFFCVCVSVCVCVSFSFITHNYTQAHLHTGTDIQRGGGVLLDVWWVVETLLLLLWCVWGGEKLASLMSGMAKARTGCCPLYTHTYTHTCTHRHTDTGRVCDKCAWGGRSR